MKHTITLLSVLLLGWLTSSAAEPNPSVHVAPGKKFVYKTSHGKPQELEVYFPKDHDPTKARVPGVILFHGGSWVSGDLIQFRYACDYFARRGLVAATANYYMHTKEEKTALGANGQFKRACVTDAATAIRWFKQHAGELGVDPQRIVTGGGSADGHICMLATLNRGLDDPADPRDIDTSVLGYLLFNPAFTANGRDHDDAVDVFAHLKPGIAPAAFFFGEQDNWQSASKVLVPELKMNNTSATLFIANGVGHSFWMQPAWYDRCLIESDHFLVSLGVLKGEPLLKEPENAKFNSEK